MTKRSSSSARVLAATAVACGFLVLIVVIASSLGGGGNGRSRSHPPAGRVTSHGGAGNGRIPAVYVVQNGDTLTSIAHRTGVSVIRLQALNPGVDPQILISGEKLKLR